MNLQESDTALKDRQLVIRFSTPMCDEIEAWRRKYGFDGTRDMSNAIRELVRVALTYSKLRESRTRKDIQSPKDAS